MSKEKAEYGEILSPYLTKMKFTDSGNNVLDVRFALHYKGETKEWWSGQVELKRLFEGLKKAGLIRKEGKDD